MREIKFRIYWKDRFYYWGYLDDGDGLYFAGPICGAERLTFKEARERSKQFTGLFDKNGKEIYEGNRVKEEDSLIYEVQWHECEWTLFRRSTTDPKTHWYRHSLRPYQKLEVVGTRHETPEFLDA